MWSDLTLDPSFKVKQGLLVLQVSDGKQATGNHGLGIFLCGWI